MGGNGSTSLSLAGLCGMHRDAAGTCGSCRPHLRQADQCRDDSEDYQVSDVPDEGAGLALDRIANEQESTEKAKGTKYNRDTIARGVGVAGDQRE